MANFARKEGKHCRLCLKKKKNIAKYARKERKTWQSTKYKVCYGHHGNVEKCQGT
jgi:hypothetical protein